MDQRYQTSGRFKGSYEVKKFVRGASTLCTKCISNILMKLLFLLTLLNNNIMVNYITVSNIKYIYFFEIKIEKK